LKRMFTVVCCVLAVIAALYMINERKKSEEQRQSAQLSEKIGQGIEGKRNGKERIEVDFAALTDFSWDKLYIFTPYTSAETISRKLGFKWSGANTIEYSESINLIVFVKGSKVVRYLELSREYGDFTVDGKNEFAPGETVENVDIH
jgi:hypothetical protein